MNNSIMKNKEAKLYIFGSKYALTTAVSYWKCDGDLINGWI